MRSIQIENIGGLGGQLSSSQFSVTVVEKYNAAENDYKFIAKLIIGINYQLLIHI